MNELMKPTFVKLEPRHKEILKGIAQRDGCTISDVIRRALIREYHLPTDDRNQSELVSNGTGVPA